jgi:predicted O-linked N-acetylglucosamine transferase (SPINDLY family)
MEDAEFTLDPYSFGGYATATDALFRGKPLVTLEGHKFYNRSAESPLQKLELHDLVTQDEDEYVNIACHLIDDSGYR